MNLTDSRYGNFALVREMLETPDIIRRFDPSHVDRVAAKVREKGRLLLTGEGSSRIFPARNMMYRAMRQGMMLPIATEGARQAMEYRLGDYAVFGTSNSGQTKELIALFAKLSADGHDALYGLTANAGTKLAEVSRECFVLSCGREEAVAATKSVVEQGLFYQSLLGAIGGQAACDDPREEAADAALEVLLAELDPGIVETIASASQIFFAGRNNGVAEELTLKTNEITRKKSAFLEGTYAVHGIEEVMTDSDVVIVVNPFEEEEQKFHDALVKGVGMQVISIASRPTLFPTIRIPNVCCYSPYLQLLAGWNVLVHVGVANGIDLDKPVRARKVGNAFNG